MAHVARRREADLRMIRVVGVVEVGLMAAYAGRVRAGQAVIAVDVALRALEGGMRSGERPSGGGVVEGAAAPVGRGVALIAIGGEAGLHVVRIRCPLEILQVAIHARPAVQAVVVIDVALRALQRGVRPGQRKPGRSVIEGCSCPVRRRMAGLAGRREPGRGVRGIIRIVEVGLMAADAGRIRARQVVISVDVALRALQRGVRAGQGEAGRGVIECCIAPRGRVVALLAGGREGGLHVARIVCVVVIGLMATCAGGIRTREVVVAVDMALRALQRGVGAGQGEAGCRVIKGSVAP